MLKVLIMIVLLITSQKFPRRDSVDSGPTPPQQQSRSAGEGGRGSQRASVARDESVSMARYAHAPRDIEDQDDLPPGDGCARDSQGYAYDDDRFDDDDDELEDRDQAAEPPLDRAFARRVDFISRIRRNLFIHNSTILCKRISSSIYQHFKDSPSIR